MNMDNFNKWLAAVSNIGVLIGIVFLVVEIRQNTTAIESDTYWNRVSGAVDLRNPIVESDEFTSIFLEYGRGTDNKFLAPLPELSSDAYRVRVYLSNLALQTEARLITQPDERPQLKTSLGLLISENPGFEDWFKASLGQFNEDFALLIEEIIRESAGEQQD